MAIKSSFSCLFLFIVLSLLSLNTNSVNSRFFSMIVIEPVNPILDELAYWSLVFVIFIEFMEFSGIGLTPY